MKRPNWWYTKEKPIVQTDSWFCYMCDDITEVEVNDILSGGQQDKYKFYGDGNGPSWASRCWECKRNHVSSWIDCPSCGFLGDNEDDIIKYGEPVFNVSKSMQFGGHPVDWETFVKCPMCDTKFSYMDSNC